MDFKIKSIDMHEIDDDIRILGDIPIKTSERKELPFFKISSSSKNEVVDILIQNHLNFSDCANYLEFYEKLNNFYDDSEKLFLDGKGSWISRKDIVAPLNFLNDHGIGNFQINRDMKYYKYVNIENVIANNQFSCISGFTDSQKTTKLISIILSFITEKIQNNKYYNISKNLLLIWDDIRNFDYWKKNSHILMCSYEYIFIDDIFNRDIPEWQKDNFITILRNAEKNGTKIIMTTNANKSEFFNIIKNMGDSLYSRFNENRFNFTEMKQKNYRIGEKQ